MKRISIFAIVINLAVILILALLYSHIPPQIPLFYGEPHGEEQLALRQLIFLPPAIATVICFLNFISERFLHDDFLKKVLLGVSIVSTLLSTVAVFKIFFLVGSLVK